MSLGRLTFTITSEDESELVVVADQRDIVKFERETRIPGAAAMEQMPNAFFWDVAFYALKRQGLVAGDVKREAWEAGVVLVKLGAAEVADPGSPEAREPKTSASRVRGVRASAKSASSGRQRT